MLENHNDIDKTTLRREKIVDIIREYENCKVSLLAKQLTVSTVTMRHDLDALEQQGCITRTYGRAVLSPHFSFKLEYREKEKLRSESKQQIALCAAKLINNGDSIIVDSGSTVALIPRHIDKDKRVVLMTNALNLATELIADPRFNVMMTGGNLRADSYSLCGPVAEQAVKLHHFDKLFIGADGIDLIAGVTTTDEQDAQLNRAMLTAANQVILVADSSKFGRRSFCVICKMAKIDTLITDNGISESDKKSLTLLGIKIIIAE
ncbi:MAG: transcriptional repressor AgaR [Glaciimonas sp.]|nr:transcriptional repressor AgaR [Glaciimonas sp.]